VLPGAPQHAALARFEILQELSPEGGQKVLLGRSKAGKLVMIKVLVQGPIPEDVGSGLSREASLAARLSHDTIVQARALLLEADFAALVGQAGRGVTVERARPDFPELLSGAALSVSQAGYNTLLDVMQAGVRAVVVPFAQPGETEQTLRADLFAARGLVHCIAEAALDGAAPGAGLAAAIDRALAAPAPKPGGLAMDGARRSAAIVAEFAESASRRQ